MIEFNFLSFWIHNPSMSFILCLVTTFLITSVQAGHKRVVIRVPQKTKYIHHHTVKKVPIYVLLPEKKPKILEALEDVKPIVRNPPCKDFYELRSVREDTSNTASRNRDKPLSEWTEDAGNRGAYYVTTADNYRTIDEDVLPPPVNFDDLPFRRVNEDKDHNFETKKNRDVFDDYRQQSSMAHKVTFTYPPPTENENYSSYEYKITH